MSWKLTLTAFVLFILLTPRILVSLPPGSKNIYLVAAIHAIVFASALYLLSHMEEGFKEGTNNPKKTTRPMPTGRGHTTRRGDSAGQGAGRGITTKPKM